MQFDNSAVWRLKMASEADAGALVRTLQFFQARSLTPRRVLAQRMSAEVLEIEIEIEAIDLTPEAFRAIVAKINELPIVLTAVACED